MALSVTFAAYSRERMSATPRRNAERTSTRTRAAEDKEESKKPSPRAIRAARIRTPRAAKAEPKRAASGARGTSQGETRQGRTRAAAPRAPSPRVPKPRDNPSGNINQHGRTSERLRQGSRDTPAENTSHGRKNPSHVASPTAPAPNPNENRGNAMCDKKIVNINPGGRPNEVCIDCDPHATYDPREKICTCDPGYAGNGLACVYLCSPFAYVDSEAKKCVCHPDFTGDGYDCEPKCPAGKIPDSATGECKSACPAGEYMKMFDGLKDE